MVRLSLAGKYRIGLNIVHTGKIGVKGLFLEYGEYSAEYSPTPSLKPLSRFANSRIWVVWLCPVGIGGDIFGVRTVCICHFNKQLSTAFAIHSCRPSAWLSITRASFFKVGDGFIYQYEICSNVGSAIWLPWPSVCRIRFCGNDYLISWIISCYEPVNKVFLDGGPW